MSGGEPCKKMGGYGSGDSEEVMQVVPQPTNDKLICQCICHCSNLADDRWEPKLCMACSLCTAIDQSANPKHGLPYTPVVEEKLEPLVHISDAQKDKAIESALGGLI